jgi:hypothetical protein
MKHLLLTLTLGIFFHFFASAQTGGEKKVVKLNNGNEYVGQILSDDGRELLIETETLGKIFVLKSDVKSISNFNQEDYTTINTEKVKSTAFSTRYSFTTNALPIKKKDNYYMINLWGPEFHVAVADNFNVGVMSTWIGSPLAVAAKYSFQTNNPKLNFSVGEIAGNMGYFDLNTYLSLSFANMTIGDRDRNVTLAGGYGIFDFNQTKYVPGTYYYDYFQGQGSYLNMETGVRTENIPTVKRKATKGFIGSVGAHLRISDKASFIFDSMFGLMENDNTTSDWLYDPVNQISYNVYKESPKQVPFFIFMPGLRLEQGEGKAVQVCVAGANVNGTTYPAPYVTWYRKL